MLHFLQVTTFTNSHKALTAELIRPSALSSRCCSRRRPPEPATPSLDGLKPCALLLMLPVLLPLKLPHAVAAAAAGPSVAAASGTASGTLVATSLSPVVQGCRAGPQEQKEQQ
jgi:hypothetical protein